MKILGHGIDLQEIEEIKREVDSPNKRWTEQFCSEEERKQAGPSPNCYRFFASSFAGKEAVAKTLGTGFSGDITWRGIEILRSSSGAPFVRLSGPVLALAESLGVTSWFISISYTRTVAAVSVIAVGER